MLDRQQRKWMPGLALAFCGLWIGLGAGGLPPAHAGSGAAGEPSTNAPSVIVVVGAGGEEEYAEAFTRWSAAVRQAASQGAARLWELGLTNEPGVSDRDRLRGVLTGLPAQDAPPLWILLVGHGTFDGRDARFNLRGPDLTANELSSWLEPFARPLVVVNCASSSGAFLKPLSRPGRVVITSTKSGSEENYSRFGSYFTAALVDVKADLDKDGQVSLLEAFLYGSAGVREFYKTEQRLASEHSLIDDNGDGLGTPADWFRGVQSTQKVQEGAGVDGRRAHQIHLVASGAERDWDPVRLARRDELESRIWSLKDRRTELSEDAYYVELEKILVELARVSLGTTPKNP